MKILLDFRVLSCEWSGIAAYTFNLLMGLCRKQGGHEYILLLKNNEIIEKLKIEDTLKKSNIRVMHLNYDVYSPKNIFGLRCLIKKENAELFFTTQFFWPYGFIPCKVIAMIHDIIPLTHPELLYCSKKSRMKLIFKFTTWLTLKLSDKIIVNSDSTLNSIKVYFGESLTRNCRKLYPVFNNNNSVQAEIKDFKYKEYKDNYFLYVGRQDPYKNIGRLLEAFKLLKDEGYTGKLLITGKIDPRYPEVIERVRHYRLLKEVIFTDFVKFDELIMLYKHAGFVVLPSLVEGFGFTALEAYIYGKVCIASDIPTIKEAINDAGLFFDPEDVNDMKRVMKKALSLKKEEKEALIKKGLDRLSYYSEDKISDDFLSIIRED